MSEPQIALAASARSGKRRLRIGHCVWLWGGQRWPLREQFQQNTEVGSLTSVWTMNGICGRWDSWGRLLFYELGWWTGKGRAVAWEGTRVRQRRDLNVFTDCLGRGSLEALVGSREGIRGEIRLSQREGEMGEEALAVRREEAKQGKLALRNLVFETLTIVF